jgi:FixJ family two-component response regulator
MRLQAAGSVLKTTTRPGPETISMANPALVVVVDDDLSVRRALKRLIGSAGYETRTFASSRELLDAGSADEAACLVLDIHLGRVSGFELLEKLRATGCRVPAVFITAFDDAESRDRATAAGATAFLRKPFDGSVLLDAIADAVDRGAPAHG